MFFWGMVLLQVQIFGTGIRHGLETLQKCGKSVITKSSKPLEANSKVCRNYMGENGREPYCTLSPLQPE